MGVGRVLKMETGMGAVSRGDRKGGEGDLGDFCNQT